jgi:glycosyltransferase involved in cell wall biosynthesis
VQLSGRVNLEEMSQWYRRAWISLVPSRHSESFGLVSLEAMQEGCVVIGSRTGGIPEVIADGETGLLFKNGSIEEMATSICSLLDNPDRLQSMRQAGKWRADTVFNWQHCAQQYEAIYHQLLE